jgi:hypothetical protein
LTPYQQPVNNITIQRVWTTLQTQANYTQAKSDVAAFNTANKWRKQGVHMTAVKYGLTDCLRFDIHVLFTDGTTRKVETVAVGDQLVGSDGEPTGVVNVSTGVCPGMYTISYSLGSHTVTPNHLVTLQLTTNPYVLVEELRLRVVWLDHSTLEWKTKNFRRRRDLTHDRDMYYTMADAVEAARRDGNRALRDGLRVYRRRSFQARFRRASTWKARTITTCISG